jgi:rhomboid-like protein
MGPPGSDQMRKARYFEYAKVRSVSVVLMDVTHTTFSVLQRMQNGLDQVRAAVESLPIMLKSFATWAYIYVAQPLVDAKEGRRVCWTIAAVNTGIWVLWQVPRLRPVMKASFTHNPLSGKSYTMLTSTFSHKSFFHLLLNSMALTSFGMSKSSFVSVIPHS